EEIGGLKKGEVSDTGGTLTFSAERYMLTIPGERTKNHRTLTLTLPPMALDILRPAVERATTEGRTHVFGSRVDKPYIGWGFAKLAMDGRIRQSTGRVLPRWTLHDLRRTFRSGLGRLGVAPHIAELCINHARKGLEATYDRYQYEKEIAQALARWGDHLASI